ncbi:MAG: hypothetical protein ABMA64_17295 [Myxococcota bacterium]
MDLIRAVGLAAHLARPDPRPGFPSTLWVDGSPVECLVYEPPSPRGTVLAVHGLSLRAHRDPRIVSVCRALEAVGFRVVCPRVASLADLRLDPELAPHLAAAAGAVLAHPRWGAPTIGWFAASFAAGMSIVAAASAPVAARVSGMFLVGAYADPWALLRHVAASADPYGRLVAVRALVDLAPPVARAVEVALQDLSLRREPQLGQVLDQLHAADRRRFEVLAAPGPLAVPAHRADGVERLAVAPAVCSLRASVTLVHGRHDVVVPPSESVRLMDLFGRNGVRARLHLTDLLDHGDLSSGVGAALEAPAVVAALRFWLRSTGVAANPPNRAPTSTGS